LKKARTGEAIPPDVIIKFAKYFEDNLTLDNMGRMQLINMCKYMGIPPYGNDNLLRFQLRHRIRLLKDDDQRILWEGIESLTKMELREACRERGMRSIGLSKIAYRNALQQWLDLSVQKNVPISLLIMSRTFFLHDEMITGESSSIGSGKGVIGLADTMSGIDKEVLNEIVLEMASSEEKSKNTEVMKIQLEVLEHQNEMIKEEQEERDAAAKEKVEKDKPDEKEPLMEKSLSIKGNDTSVDGVAPLANPASSPPEVAILRTVDANSIEYEPKEDEQAELSTAEIDAISQLASSDPVLREREELKRIKDKMHGEIGVDSGAQTVLFDKFQEEVAIAFKEINDAIEKEAKEILLGGTELKQTIESHDDEPVGDKKLQKAIDRLKSKVESMVGKIETQLSHVEVKIGSKFHLLDKDGDGVLTMEEMAQVLQTVLKRELTAEEAMAIAEDMDHNKDGVFSIAELAQWAETNTIVKLAEDGREKDLNDMISARVADLNERKKMKQEAIETPSN
jgi:LETM1 and EF-hand domain-containing protein 1